MDDEKAGTTVIRMARLNLQTLCSSHSPPLTDRLGERLLRLARRIDGAA